MWRCGSKLGPVTMITTFIVLLNALNFPTNFLMEYFSLEIHQERDHNDSKNVEPAKVQRFC